MGRMFGRKSGPRNKGKNCGLQQPNGIFFFLCIIEALCHENNLSNSLPSRKIPVIKRKKCADLMIDTFRSMTYDEDFDSVF